MGLNILPHLIMTNLQLKCLIKKIKEKKVVNKSGISLFIDYSDIDK